MSAAVRYIAACASNNQVFFLYVVDMQLVVTSLILYRRGFTVYTMVWLLFLFISLHALLKWENIGDANTLALS